MAAKSRTALRTVYETGDVPVQGDYEDLIDSYVSLTDTSAQVVNSDLSVNGFNANSVSANTISTQEINGPIAVSATATFNREVNVSGNLTFTSSAQGLRMKNGERFGQIQMVAGEAIVSGNTITTNSVVMLTIASVAGSATGRLRVSALSAGHFTIKSNDADVSTVNYLVIESV